MKAAEGFSGAFRAAAVIGAFAFRDLYRRRFFAGVAVLMLFFAAGSSFLVQIDFGGDPRRFVLDFCFGALALFGTALAVALTAVSLREPVERKTLDLLLVRPCGRGTVFAGLFGGSLAALTLFVLAAGIFVAAFAWRYSPVPETPGGGADVFGWGGFAFALWIAWLRLVVIASMAFLVAAVVDSVPVAVLLGLVLAIIGEVHGIAAEVWRQGGEGAVTAGLLAVLRLIPDLRYLQAGVYLHGAEVSASGFAALTLYALIFAAGYAVLAVFVLIRRAG